MMKTLKNKFFLASFIAVLAVFGMISTKVSATTTSTTVNSDIIMNPPALGVLPLGCDLGVGTVYSPETGESCSIKGGATITPPVVMMSPYNAYGCKAGSPFSMTTGNRCATKLPSIIIEDCMTAKNSTCATIVSNPTTLVTYANDVCIDGTVINVDSTGKPYCTLTVDGTVKTMPTLVLPIRVSSTTDMRAVQKALNSALKNKLSTSIDVDGKTGPRTRAAIKMFQKSVYLKTDGIIGPKTILKLRTSFQ